MVERRDPLPRRPGPLLARLRTQGPRGPLRCHHGERGAKASPTATAASSRMSAAAGDPATVSFHRCILVKVNAHRLAAAVSHRGILADLDLKLPLEISEPARPSFPDCVRNLLHGQASLAHEVGVAEGSTQRMGSRPWSSTLGPPSTSVAPTNGFRAPANWARDSRPSSSLDPRLPGGRTARARPRQQKPLRTTQPIM